MSETMEAKKKKTAKKQPIVKKPYLTGHAVDGSTVKSAAMFLVSLLVMMVAFLMLSAMMLWDNVFIRVGFNGALLALCYVLFYQSGTGAGAGGVEKGEIMYQRENSGRTVEMSDRAQCFHPAKGIVTALIGSIPLALCAVLLAVTAEKQVAGLGSLPNWLAALERRSEIGGALTHFHQTGSIGLTGAMRMVVRMALMPMVNMIGAENADGLLLLERLSPLLTLLPAVAYGAGYLRGVDVRDQVHTDIAKGKRKQAKKARKQRQARAAGKKGPEQLN